MEYRLPSCSPGSVYRLGCCSARNGKTRSDFMIDASRRAAEDALLDQTLVQVDPDSYKHYLAVLDQPPRGEGFERLMNAPKPWQP